MIKLYAGAAIVALIALGWWRYDYIVKDRDSLKAQLAASQEALKTKDAVIVTERAESVAANTRAIATQIEKKAIENEANILRNCIDDESCGVRVQFKFNTCPNIHNATAGGPGANESAESNARNFQKWVIDTEESIRLNLLQISNLQDDLKVRSKENYCRPHS